MNLYALALSATRKGETYIVPAHAYASSKTEAHYLGLETIKEQLPTTEGYDNHAAAVDLIPDEFMATAGWQRKRVGRKRKEVIQ